MTKSIEVARGIAQKLAHDAECMKGVIASIDELDQVINRTALLQCEMSIAVTNIHGRLEANTGKGLFDDTHHRLSKHAVERIVAILKDERQELYEALSQ